MEEGSIDSRTMIQLAASTSCSLEPRASSASTKRVHLLIGRHCGAKVNIQTHYGETCLLSMATPTGLWSSSLAGKMGSIRHVDSWTFGAKGHCPLQIRILQVQLTRVQIPSCPTVYVGSSLS